MLEMTSYALTYCGKLHNVITHNVIRANQKTNLFFKNIFLDLAY